MKEFKQLMLGDQSIPFYMAAMVFAFMGIIISLYADSRKRDVLSTSTPIQYSWRFLFWDNTKRIFIGLLVMFLLFRLTVEIFGSRLNMAVAVGVGFALSLGLDQVIALLKERFSIFQMPREKFKQ